ncbi:MAG TPA: gamma carbonic anhydrase family protein [Paracoccaceae bacterium]|nr:gamma carbonic anhydrase family protein [Paracoccaceae bacterium]
MPIWELDGNAPALPADGSAWIAPGAQIIGRVTLAQGVSIWFNAVLRGDNEPITIGRESNVQDGCIFHVDPGFPLVIGAEVTIGHKAILHGCTIGDGSLIGMGAVVMNGARIGESCLIGAGALVPEGREIPPRSLVLGQPAKLVRSLDDATVALIREGSAHYRTRQDQYRKGLREVG